MRRIALVLPLLALPLALAACGGGGAKTYEETGLNITFKYPSSFVVVHDVTISRTAGAAPADQAAVGLDSDNVMIVSRYNLRIEVGKANLADVKGKVDKLIGTLARKSVSGREVEYGGLPGYEYVIPISKPANGVSRIAVLFDGAVEYYVNCQSTPEKRSKVEDACRTLLESIKQI